MKIGNVIHLNEKRWIIFDYWGEFDEYICVTDFETQKINELIPKEQIKDIDIEDCQVKWLFILRRERNLADIKEYMV